jgi:hypothetical protein
VSVTHATVILNEGRKPGVKDLVFAFDLAVDFDFATLEKAKATTKANARSFASGFAVGSG